MVKEEIPEYRAYIQDVASGRVELPAWDIKQQIEILPGELFCRYPKCPKATKQFSSTNNLRKHVVGHDDIHLTPGKNGGVPIKDTIKAQEFFRSLYSNNFNHTLPPNTLSTPPSKTPPSKRKGNAAGPSATKKQKTATAVMSNNDENVFHDALPNPTGYPEPTIPSM